MAADFILDFPAGKEIRILQVTDTQIIDSSQCRYEGRLCEREMALWQPEKIEERMGKYLRGVVAKTSPDIIVHTGDFSYGEFDDKGTSFSTHVEMMDSFGVPWCLALGNHERETKKGVSYLCAGLRASKHGLFKGDNFVKGEKCEGEGNYCVLIRQGGMSVAVLYFLDSGCGTAEYPSGVHEVQRKWLKERSKGFEGIPGYAFFHIPPSCAAKKLKKYGYDKENFAPYEIPDNEDGDFGFVGEWGHDYLYIDWDDSLMQLFEEIGIKRVFVGHIHKHAYTLKCGNIFVTHGAKTGEYDSHDKAHLGGTLLTLSPTLGEIGVVENVFVKGEDNNL